MSGRGSGIGRHAQQALGRALRNISAATSRGRLLGNDAGIGPPKMPLGGQGGHRADRQLVGRSQELSPLGRTRASLGPWALDGASVGLSGRGRKRRADRVDTSTLAPRFMVRCADYIPVLAINVPSIPDWGSHPSLLEAGETVVPPRRFLLQQTRNIARPHFWWPWDASIGPLSCAQHSQSMPSCYLPCLLAVYRQRGHMCTYLRYAIHSTWALTYIDRPVELASICMT